LSQREGRGGAQELRYGSSIRPELKAAHACMHTYTHSYDLITLYYSFLSPSQAVVFRKQGQRGKVKKAVSRFTAMPSATMGKILCMSMAKANGVFPLFNVVKRKKAGH